MNESTKSKPGRLRRAGRSIAALLCVYLLCLGPAFRLFGVKGLLPYAPLLFTAYHLPPVRQPMMWYVNLWAPKGLAIEIDEHGFGVSESLH